jgi:hypothetical protein
MVAATQQRRYQSDYVEGGYADRLINLNTAEASATVSTLIADGLLLLTDGNPANDRAGMEKLVIAGKVCDELVYTNLTAAGGDLTEAKRRSKKMVEIGSESAEKRNKDG